jgi:hypothetical protein
MRSAALWILYIVVMVDCATAGWLLPWPVPQDFWRVCFLLGTSCAAGIFTGFDRGGAIGPPNGYVALAVAIGFLVRGLITLLAVLTR